MFTLEFEQLAMRENEHFKDFYVKHINVTNLAYTVGKKYLESKILKKSYTPKGFVDLLLLFLMSK